MKQGVILKSIITGLRLEVLRDLGNGQYSVVMIDGNRNHVGAPLVASRSLLRSNYKEVTE